MVLQLNGGEPAFQIRQTARPNEFETALRGALGFCRSRLRQELDELSTCFCAKTGEVSYLAINVSLLITNHATCNRQASQSGIGTILPGSIIRCVQSARPFPTSAF